MQTNLGSVLIGSPAGTLKDILKGELDMPKVLIAPHDSFSRTLGSHLGLNLAEVSFWTWLELKSFNPNSWSLSIPSL